MVKRVMKNKCSENTGSATVEAVVAFTGFLLVIFTILNVVNFCRAQMLISNAVDTAAKELAQYSYFYKMSGLQKFSKDVKENADIGAGNLNQVIGTVDGLYKSLGEATNNTVQNVTDMVNATESVDDAVNSVQHTLSNLSSDLTQIDTSINAVTSAFEGVANNPILYLKSIVAVAGNDALDLVKSHAIAAPLARLFTIKHFGSTREEADSCLRKLGVVDGIDGMNFKMSTMFSSEEPNTVHLMVYYKLKMPQVFGWIELEAPVCKEAITYAWLGGDDVLVRVTSQLEETLEPTEEEEDNTEGNEDSDKQEDDNKEPDDPPEEVTEIDTSNSIWYLPERDEHYYNQLEGTLLQEMGERYSVRSDMVVQHYHGCNSEGVAYSMEYCREERDAKFIASDVMMGLEFAASNNKRYYESNGKEGELAKTYEMIVFVPENIPAAKIEAIKETVDEKLKLYAEMTIEEYGLPSDFQYNVQYVKTGGNYDYGG